MWQNYINATSIDEVLQILAERGERARIVAGATDLILEIERGVRKGIDTLVDVSRIHGLDRIALDEEENIHLGPLVTHNHCVASKLIHERAFVLAQAAWEVGAPQIRNRGTIAGNLITASPANDTIPALFALDAYVVLRSLSAERRVPLADFYMGVRRTVMTGGEMLVDIVFPALQPNQCSTFYKLGLRRAQAISLVNAALVLTFEGDGLTPDGPRWGLQVKRAAIALGSVAPVIVHAEQAERYLEGQMLSEEVIEQAAVLAVNATAPIDDVRSSGDYRREMVRVSVLRGLRSLGVCEERRGIPEQAVFLWENNRKGKVPSIPATLNPNPAEAAAPIVTNINGSDYIFITGHHKTLMRLLREEAGLTGTKEGCAEGECGACTVFLDGMAVMSCLVPAPRAHGARIVTIEGLAQGEQLHPVQQTFIEEGAVQCGYCTPGFLMSAAMLLDEEPHPTRDQIRQAITGNLCRCTGYYKIIDAIERASLMEVSNG